MRTGNLAAVMKTMGHRDVKTAMRYQHPELEIVRAALDCGATADTTEKRGLAGRVKAHSAAHPENHNAGKLLEARSIWRQLIATGD